MIGIDTNVIARYITQDDSKQARIANEIIEKHANEDDGIFINNIVLCELVWVLDRGYKYSRKEIITVLQHILTTKGFSFENHETLWLALLDYEKKNCDYSDALLGKINASKGCKSTISFDQGTASLKEFKQLRAKT